MYLLYVAFDKSVCPIYFSFRLVFIYFFTVNHLNILIPPIHVIYGILLHIALSIATFHFTAYPVCDK